MRSVCADRIDFGKRDELRRRRRRLNDAGGEKWSEKRQRVSSCRSQTRDNGDMGNEEEGGVSERKRREGGTGHSRGAKLFRHAATAKYPQKSH